MKKSLRVLIVEDSEDDTALVLETLKERGYNPVYKRVEIPEEMIDALRQSPWDVVVSDYTMPRFNALAAMRLIKEAGLDIPFIIVTGSIGEEIAVRAMKAGAHDYMMKDNLSRLSPAIEREMQEAVRRREHRQADDELKNSRQQLRDLAARLNSIREKERAWISREIHDELGQLFTSIKYELSLLRKRIVKQEGHSEAKTDIEERLKTTSDMVDTAIKTVQKIATELRPGILDDLGLMAAIEWQASEFQQRTGIACRLHTDLQIVQLDHEQATAVFRIFQEVLTNIVRHAGATRVEIRIKEKAGRLYVDIKDNGRGITAEERFNPKSLGLLGMRERVLLLNGEIRISGASKKGTHVHLKIPLKAGPPSASPEAGD
ncbi:MAG: response regulator [Candidatus Manganitrophaceae bacterium]|nr:MAG: response regulator [Candidatus Manganitrophaceae bacterium]